MHITYHYPGEYPDSMLLSSVVVARYDEKWCFGWRGGFSLPVAEIYVGLGEHAEDAARRLISEMGAVDYELIPVNIVAERESWDDEPMRSMLYFAKIHTFETPAKELIFSEDYPAHFSKTATGAYLFAYVKDFLEPKHEKEELWDVYDKDRNFVGRTHKRGELIPEGDYHLVVHTWVQNTDGRILLTQRSANKGFPHLWECSGGAVTAGEDSLTAAVREVYEETGLSIQPENGKVIKTMRRINDIVDVWLFRADVDLSKICLQERETCDAKLVTVEELLAMAKEETLVPYSYMQEAISFFERKEHEKHR